MPLLTPDTGGDQPEAAEYKNLHPATALLRYFTHDHLPPPLAAVSKLFHALASQMAYQLDGPELTAGLRKLLEAKDCCVRAALDRAEDSDDD